MQRRQVAESWGRVAPVQHAGEEWLGSSRDVFPQRPRGLSLLAHGCGRSYGDVCLNAGNTLIRTGSAAHYLAFDPETGVIKVEAGVTISQILCDFLPRGWLLPTSPGTQFVTIGGAIANDVHGKNHHAAGSFGCHVLELELLRSSGERLVCSATQNQGLFRATIGGLGLTGLITQATLQLVQTASPFIDEEIIPFSCLDELFRLNRESVSDFQYTVSWIDCLARGRQLGRGLFMRGNPSTQKTFDHILRPDGSRCSGRRIAVPSVSVSFEAPSIVLSWPTVRIFNTLYFAKVSSPLLKRTVPLQSFLYPLDAIGNWNRLYGKRGFFQWQGVIPGTEPIQALKQILRAVTDSRQASPLVVLKAFGGRRSPGLLSFPMEGVTLAIDFANRGSDTIKLLHKLDEIAIANGGRIYPAKDAVMEQRTFLAGFPQFGEFAGFRDPGFYSSFARRLQLF